MLFVLLVSVLGTICRHEEGPGHEGGRDTCESEERGTDTGMGAVPAGRRGEFGGAGYAVGGVGKGVENGRGGTGMCACGTWLGVNAQSRLPLSLLLAWLFGLWPLGCMQR